MKKPRNQTAQELRQAVRDQKLLAEAEQLALTIRNLKYPLLTVQLTTTLAQRLYKTAHELNVPAETLVRRALDSYLSTFNVADPDPITPEEAQHEC